MSWQQLRANHRVQTHSTSHRELAGLRAIVERDLKDARLPGLSTDRQFATAYNAMEPPQNNFSKSTRLLYDP